MSCPLLARRRSTSAAAAGGVSPARHNRVSFFDCCHIDTANCGAHPGPLDLHPERLRPGAACGSDRAVLLDPNSRGLLEPAAKVRVVHERGQRLEPGLFAVLHEPGVFTMAEIATIRPRVARAKDSAISR